MFNFNRILVVNLAGIGDIVISSPAVRALKERFSESDIYLLTFADNRELVMQCPYVKEVLIFDKYFSLRNLRTLTRIKNLKCDAAVNLYNIHSWQGALKMFFLFYFIRAKVTFGRNTDGRGFFFNHKLDESFPPQCCDTETMLKVVRLMGARGYPKDLELWVTTQSHAVDRFLGRYNIKEEDRVVCVHPGASKLIHRWPVKNFSYAADQLIEKHGVKIIIIGTRQERILAEDMVKSMKQKAIVAAGELSLADLVFLLQKAKLLITNDTGPMHIANALRIPLVVISGNSPQAFLPFYQENTVILRKDSVSSFVGARLKRVSLPIFSITPEEVVKASAPLLSSLQKQFSFVYETR